MRILFIAINFGKTRKEERLYLVTTGYLFSIDLLVSIFFLNAACLHQTCLVGAVCYSSVEGLLLMLDWYFHFFSKILILQN